MTPTILTCVLAAVLPIDRRAALRRGAETALLAAAAAPTIATAAPRPVLLPSPSQLSRRRVFVCGASGRTGRSIVEQLQANGVPLVAGVRTQASANRLDPSLPRIVVDLSSGSDEPSSLTDATVQWLGEQMQREGVTDVISTLGYFPTFVPVDDRALAERVDYCAQLRLIAAARAAKLEGRFIMVSSLLTDEPLADNPSARMLNSALGNVLEQKRKAEAALRSGTPSLDWTIVRPGLLDVKKPQGGVLLGPAGRWVGSAERDRVAAFPGSDAPSRCASPFLASSGAVCAVTRAQLAAVCIGALGDEQRGVFSRRVVEVVARPEAPQGPREVGWVI